MLLRKDSVKTGTVSYNGGRVFDPRIEQMLVFFKQVFNKRSVRKIIFVPVPLPTW